MFGIENAPGGTSVHLKRGAEHYEGCLSDVTRRPAAFSMITFNYILFKSLIEKYKCMNGNKKIRTFV